ncbi:AAHS family benzoate transporter-like MFS transporter [Nocardia tenerifensis]|uniref:AAHS family benzoate transporter-like MFS transporter n=1 Tax=Nocardia tenerifensis TaxID=228006 RepID=A0A318KPA3_9NOCA|nr:MFS transporter [Nocardia tenerifensis]PXX71510.1 AAHS family benzoate transporter-like MFS transporter [Nocardia tenerifensis]
MTTSLPAPRRQAVVLILACAILFVDGYDLFTLGTIGPSLLHDRSWGASPATLGTLGSITALGMPIGSILAGWAADRWGRRTPMVVAVCWISASMLAAAFVSDLQTLSAARFCTGIGIGALAPLVSAFVTDGAPAHRRTLHLAIALGSIGVGGTASAFLGRLLLPDHHFQTLFLIGAVPILLAPVIWRWVPAEAPHRREDAAPERVSTLLSPRIRRDTILFWIATFMSMALVYSTTAWLPTIMMKNGYNLSSSLEFLIAFTIGASLGGLGAAVFADRGKLKLVTMGTFALAAVALLTLSTNQPRPLLLIVSALAGLGSLGCQNMVIAAMSAYYPPRLRGTALGFGLGVGRLGAIAGPTYLSLATTLIASPRAGFLAFTIPALLGAATTSFLPRTLTPPESITPPAPLLHQPTTHPIPD